MQPAASDDIIMRSVTKKFGDTVALEDFSLVINAKELLVLLGPSGCGKTTTLNLLAGLEQPTSGEIYFGDRLVNNVPAEKREISMVFQTIGLYPHLNALENIAFPLKLRNERQEVIDKRIAEMVEILGIKDLLNRQLIELSGGERQRVAIAKALIKRPYLFLLDEPFSSLDADRRRQLRADLVRIHRQLDTTMLFVTHDQEEAMSVADRIWELRSKATIEFSTPENVAMECAPCFYSGSTPRGGIEGRLTYIGLNYAGGGPIYEGEKADVWPKYGIFTEDSHSPQALVLARPTGPMIARNGPPAGSTVHKNGPIYSWPSCSIGESDGEKLKEWLASGEIVTARYFANTRLKSNCTTTIVCGVIKGTQYPDEVVILGAHHDTVGAFGMPPSTNSPGACDNASGVAILIELARMYATEPPGRTLWLCSFGGEERHLVGSSAYARILNEAGNLDRVVAYLGIDQAAYGDVLRLLASDDEPHLTPQIRLRKILATAAEDLQLSERFNTYGPDPVHAASDHWPFFYAGIPSFLTGWHPFDGWHRHTDSIELCTEDDKYLATADLLNKMLRRISALPEIGPVERSPADGYVLHPPAV